MGNRIVSAFLGAALEVLISPLQSTTNPSSQGSKAAVQAVIFDLDGVLLDSEWLAFQAWQEVAAARGAALSEACYPEMIGMAHDATAHYVMQKTGLIFDVEENCQWTWQRVLEQIRAGVEPLPGAVELVRGLAANGCQLAIASNAFSEYIDTALNGLGIADAFPVRVGIDRVARGKPAPDVYLLAAQQLGAHPARCLAVEDSAVGVQAAAAAGMRVIAVPDRRASREAYTQAWRIYPSLLEVSRDLDHLLACDAQHKA